VLEVKRRELQEIGPGGWKKAAAYAAVCLPLWIANIAGLAVQYATR
jgi:hypothetical protein